MHVSREDVRRVAALARLDLSDEEVERLARELGGILEHMEALHDGDLPDDRGSADGAVDAGADVLRGDEPGSDPLSGGPETFAPELRGGFFTVPRLASHDRDGG